LSTVNAEFGYGLNLNAYRGRAYYSSVTPYGSNVFNGVGSLISMSHFRGTQLAQPSLSIDYMIVGGGGGGAIGIHDQIGGGAGGGGGGAIITGSTYVWFNTTNTITIGAGGVGGSEYSTPGPTDKNGNTTYNNVAVPATNGSVSTLTRGNIGGISAAGGSQGYNNNNGYRGGNAGADQNLGGAYNTVGGSNGIGGGGGGGGVDDAGSSAPGGAGGVWNGFRFAGGGGGGSDYTNGGDGGLGGGGKGGSNVSGIAGTVNTGGGGGGGGSSGAYTYGGGGGSGIVLIRYAGTTQRVTGGSSSYALSGYFYHLFTVNQSTFVANS
jgi:hypothetical protein